MATTPSTDYGARQCDLAVDVVVVGAGITGLTTSLLLARRGKKVALIDKGEIAEAESGHTTAHLTEIVDTRYHDLISHFGENRAYDVKEASRHAIQLIHALSRELGIACTFEYLPAYLYAEQPEEVEPLLKELEAMGCLEISAAWTSKTPLPFPVEGAIRVEEQAQFHPRKYLLGLAEAFVKLGGIILENTRAEDFIDDTPCRVVTENGTLVASKVVVAAHNPISNRLFLQTKIAAYRTYAIGARLETLPNFRGLFWDCQEPYHYIRTQVIEGVDHRPEAILIVGGEDHKTGMVENTEDCLARLEDYTRARFGVKSIPYRWSGQILEPVDGLPFIGTNSFSRNFFVATGYTGNGMTFGTVAGMLLCDLVSEISNPLADLFDATRIKVSGALGNYVTENKDFATCFIRDRFERTPDIPLMRIQKNQGALLTINDQKVAAMRDANGNIRFFSPVCPHMGCHVQWNSAETSWDCPCHGSRFSCEGKVLNGPALSPLREMEAREVFKKKTDREDVPVLRPEDLPGAA